MPFEEAAVSVGFFVVSLAIAVYLIRYSNQSVTKCIVALEDRHNELVDLNSRLARQILESDKKLRADLTSLKKR